MQTFDACGAVFSPKMFIDIFQSVKKVAPPRFLTLRLHPDRYKDLFRMADIPMSIQLGNVPGPVPGRSVVRVNCIKPPMGVQDGITLVQDEEVDPTQLIFEIHGIAELIVRNINVQPSESARPKPDPAAGATGS